MTLQACALRVMGQDVRPRPPHRGAWSFDQRQRFRGRDVTSVPWLVRDFRPRGLCGGTFVRAVDLANGGFEWRMSDFGRG